MDVRFCGLWASALLAVFLLFLLGLPRSLLCGLGGLVASFLRLSQEDEIVLPLDFCFEVIEVSHESFVRFHPAGRHRAAERGQALPAPIPLSGAEL